MFDYDPEVGDLKVSRFTEDSLDDFFTQTAWTLEGRLGALDVVYTGAFLDREVDAKLDYTGYTNIGKFIAGYQCEYLVGSFYNGVGSAADTTYFWDPTIGGDPGVIECGNPANAVNLENDMTRWTHELRVATVTSKAPLNFQGGVFYEDFEILHRGDFNYLAPFEAGFAPIDINSNSNLRQRRRQRARRSLRPARSSATTTPARRNSLRCSAKSPGTSPIRCMPRWVSATTISSTGSRVTVLGATATARCSWTTTTRPTTSAPHRTGGRDYEVNLDLIEPLKTDDTIVKFTVSWAPGGNSLFYGTWSEGYRPPGFNRGAAAASAVYDPDANNCNSCRPGMRP